MVLSCCEYPERAQAFMKIARLRLAGLQLECWLCQRRMPRQSPLRSAKAAPATIAGARLVRRRRVRGACGQCCRGRAGCVDAGIRCCGYCTSRGLSVCLRDAEKLAVTARAILTRASDGMGQ